MNNIIFLRLSALGDLVHCLPLYHSIHSAYPNAIIHWVVDERFAALIQNLPNIRLHLVNKKNLYKLIDSAQQIKRQLHHEPIDLFVNVHDSMSANLATLFLPKPKNKQMVIGLAKNQSRDVQRWFVSNTPPDQSEQQHAVDQYLNLLGVLKLPKKYCFDLGWNLSVNAKPTEKKHLLFNLSVSNDHTERSLSEKIYCLLLDELYAKISNPSTGAPQYQIDLTGEPSPVSKALANRLMSRYKDSCDNLVMMNSVGKTSLNQWLDLLKVSSLVVSPDSAAVHLADSMATPCLSIYVATNPKKIGPYQNTRYCLDFYAKARQSKLNKKHTWDKKIHNSDLESFLDERLIVQKWHELIDEVLLRTEQFKSVNISVSKK